MGTKSSRDCYGMFLLLRCLKTSLAPVLSLLALFSPKLRAVLKFLLIAEGYVYYLVITLWFSSPNSILISSFVGRIIVESKAAWVFRPVIWEEGFPIEFVTVYCEVNFLRHLNLSTNIPSSLPEVIGCYLSLLFMSQYELVVIYYIGI